MGKSVAEAAYRCMSHKLIRTKNSPPSFLLLSCVLLGDIDCEIDWPHVRLKRGKKVCGDLGEACHKK